LVVVYGKLFGQLIHFSIGLYFIHTYIIWIVAMSEITGDDAYEVSAFWCYCNTVIHGLATTDFVYTVAGIPNTLINTSYGLFTNQY
jgi:hypothetical protein